MRIRGNLPGELNNSCSLYHDLTIIEDNSMLLCVANLSSMILCTMSDHGNK